MLPIFAAFLLKCKSGVNAGLTQTPQCVLVEPHIAECSTPAFAGGTPVGADTPFAIAAHPNIQVATASASTPVARASTLDSEGKAVAVPANQEGFKKDTPKQTSANPNFRNQTKGIYVDCEAEDPMAELHIDSM